MRLSMSLFTLAVCTLPCGAGRAETQADRFGAGGYFRIMTRPDLQGGDSRLGYWNLYGRLLNEGPWGALELKLDVLQSTPGSNDVWASLHTKIEGGSFANSDANQGWLGQFRVSQMYVRAGNILFPHVTWQLGTLDSYFGDLGLYDMKPAQIFFDTVGLSGRYDDGPIEILLGLGDAGYFLRGTKGQVGRSLVDVPGGQIPYSTILSGGGYLRVRLGEHLEMGGGGQGYYEPEVRGNRFAPHDTPNVAYEDFVRGEVVQHYLDNNPGMEEMFGRNDATRPVARSSTSVKLVGYLGFGKLGPVRWSSLFANWLKRHPDNFVAEHYQGRDYTIYVADLTDERLQINVGNEMQLTLIPERLDAVWAMIYGRFVDADNTIKPGDDNREFYSTVLRFQVYLTPTIHLLLENAFARERSLNGKLWRQHYDSLFTNDGAIADARGLQYGDTAQRITWQGKGGVVFNPLGTGIYTRPSLRLLYGTQYSNVHNAFGNNFADSLDQYNQFPERRDRHWHSVVAIEAEAWF
jgi:hypothetical protein